MDELFKSHQIISLTRVESPGEKIDLCLNDIISFEPDKEDDELTLINCMDGKNIRVRESLATIIKMLESVD